MKQRRWSSCGERSKQQSRNSPTSRWPEKVQPRWIPRAPRRWYTEILRRYMSWQVPVLPHELASFRAEVCRARAAGLRDPRAPSACRRQRCPSLNLKTMNCIKQPRFLKHLLSASMSAYIRCGCTAVRSPVAFSFSPVRGPVAQGSREPYLPSTAPIQASAFERLLALMFVR